jgi:hypothetical protein
LIVSPLPVHTDVVIWLSLGQRRQTNKKAAANEVYATFRKDAWERVRAEFAANGSFPNWQSYTDDVLVRKIGKLLDSAKDSILTGNDLTSVSIHFFLYAVLYNAQR